MSSLAQSARKLKLPLSMKYPQWLFVIVAFISKSRVHFIVYFRIMTFIKPVMPSRKGLRFAIQSLVLSVGNVQYFIKLFVQQGVPMSNVILWFVVLIY